jgi:polar amino acid transport system substrate-binding protein
LGFILLRTLNQFHVQKLKAKTLNWIFELSDALGLAAFTVTGVVIAVKMKCTPLLLWGPILAVITTVGGGILRDLFRKDRHIEALQGTLYAEIAILWGLMLSLFIMGQEVRIDPAELYWAVIGCLIGVFVTRVIAVAYHIKSPLYGNKA